MNGEEEDEDQEGEQTPDPIGKALEKLKRENLKLYIVLKEYRLAGGSLFWRIRREPVAPWGFYKKLAKRWDCSDTAVRNWTNEALNRFWEILGV